MVEQIPVIIMTVLLLAGLYVAHIVFSGVKHGTDEPDKRSKGSRERSTRITESGWAAQRSCQFAWSVGLI